MCLYIDNIKTKRFLNKHKNDVWVNVYKYYCVDNGRVYAPYQGKQVRKSGWIKSNRKNKKFSDFEKEYGEVEKGIHVYKSLNDTRGYTSWNDYLVKARARMSDFVCCGLDGDAVFTKIFVSKSEFDRIKAMW